MNARMFGACQQVSGFGSGLVIYLVSYGIPF